MIDLIGAANLITLDRLCEMGWYAGSAETTLYPKRALSLLVERGVVQNGEVWSARIQVLTAPPSPAVPDVESPNMGSEPPTARRRWDVVWPHLPRLRECCIATDTKASSPSSQ